MIKLKNNDIISTAGSYELKDDSFIHYYPSYFSEDESNLIFDKLKNEINWEQCISRFGPVPRLNAWNSEVGLDYSYSGIIHTGCGWNNNCFEILNKINNQFHYGFNSLLLNYYRHGGDSIGKHSDAEPPLGLNPVVASISFGCSRRFKISHQIRKINNRYLSHKMILNHGDLLIMDGAFQHVWHHELPKENNVKEERISLTFRKIIT